MKIILIAAMDLNNAIGKNGGLPWHIPKDFNWFKEQTLNQTILMGRKCYEDIIKYSKGKPLPNRTNIILTSQQIETHPDFKIISSIEQLYRDYSHLDKIFIIGGSQIYNQFIDKADTLILTKINTVIDKADTFFPPFNASCFEQTFLKEDFDDNYSFTFEIYEKKM